MTQTHFDTLDRIALVVSGGLMLLGIVVLGLVEVVAGKPYGASPITNDAGNVVATPAIDPTIRTGLVILGLVVLMLWGLYRMVTVVPSEESTTSDAHTTA